MAKENRKQIVEQTRNEVARQYKAQIASLQESLLKADGKKNEYARKVAKQCDEILALQEKVSQYEDWIRRLQEFMDMEPDAREKAFAEMKLRTEIDKKLNGIMGVYGSLFSLL